MPDITRPAPNQIAPQPSHLPKHAFEHTRLLDARALLPSWQRRCVYASTALLTATGLAWLALYVLAPDLQEGLSGLSMFPWQAGKQWSMRLHAIGALASCVAVGSLLPLHVSGAWQRRVNRISGGTALGIFALLTLTGYALWYAPEGAVRQAAAWLHWGFGCAAPFGLWLHIRLGRKLRKRSGFIKLNASPHASHRPAPTPPDK